MKSRVFLSVVVVTFTAWTLVTSFEPSPKAALIARQKTKVAERIQRVENGLLPAVVIKGQSAPMKLAERMAHYKVPGLSVAVINDGKIDWARGYGVVEKDAGKLVTPDTLFLAGSISKPVAALAALRLVEQGKLSRSGHGVGLAPRQGGVEGEEDQMTRGRGLRCSGTFSTTR